MNKLTLIAIAALLVASFGCKKETTSGTSNEPVPVETLVEAPEVEPNDVSIVPAGNVLQAPQSSQTPDDRAAQVAEQEPQVAIYPDEAIDLHNSGVRHWIGDGVPQDSAKAAEFFQQASDMGHPGSQHNMGVLYWHGDGVERDFVKARTWLIKSGESGVPDALFKVASIYATGSGVEVDYLESANWLRKAAVLGHAEAQSNLATLYMRGDGVERDVDEAIGWYLKAAEQGVASAQSNMGVFYASGQGVEVDMVKAEQWFRKASEQFHVTALYNLGGLYMEGKVVEQDNIEAYKYFALARELGDPDASRALMEVTSKMEPQELAKGIREASSVKRQAFEELQANIAKSKTATRTFPKPFEMPASAPSSEAN